MQHKLDVDDLNVETFIAEPLVADYAAGAAIVGIVETGCVMPCESGMFCFGL